jgi:hypothetical protein
VTTACNPRRRLAGLVGPACCLSHFTRWLDRVLGRPAAALPAEGAPVVAKRGRGRGKRRVAA